MDVLPLTFCDTGWERMSSKSSKTVHESVLELGEATKEKNFEAVTKRYLNLYQGCVSCHVNNRKTIRKSRNGKSRVTTVVDDISADTPFYPSILPLLCLGVLSVMV